MPLPRQAHVDEIFDRVELNAYDCATKKIIFSGTALEIANHLGVQQVRVRDALKRKYKLLRKYAIRIKSLKELE